MTKRISAMDLRKRLGQVMNEVSLRDDAYIIERDGRPIVAVLPLWKFRQLEERKERFWRSVEEFRKEGRKAGNTLPSVIEEAVRAAKRGKAAS